MGKIYQVTVVGIQGEKKTVDVATTEDSFNNTTVLEFKNKLVQKLPGNIGNYCVFLTSEFIELPKNYNTGINIL